MSSSLTLGQFLKLQVVEKLVLMLKSYLKVSDNLPRNLYYAFEPDNLNIIPPVKLRIFEDTDVNKNNSIGIVPNKFDGVYTLSGVTSDTYEYNIPYNIDTVTS